MNPRILAMAVVLLALPVVVVAQSMGSSQAPLQRVDVSGSENVSWSASTTAAVREPLECSFSPTSVYTVAAGVLGRATVYYTDGGTYNFGRFNHMQIVNVDDKDTMRCGVGFLDAGTSPSCTTPGWGMPLFPLGGAVDFAVTENEEVWCLGCGGAADVAVTVSLCVP